MTEQSPSAPAHAHGFDRRGALKSLGLSLTINALRPFLLYRVLQSHFCKRRRENPSVKRPDRPVAPEQKSGSRRSSAKMGRGRREERRGTVRAGAASGVCGGDEPAGSGAAVWDRPANGGEDAGVLGAAGIPAESAACAAEAGSVPRDH